MLIQFTIGNYRTFREKATLSMVASNYDKETREKENISSDNKFDFRLLKSAAIYGANASGKSKFFEAFSFMQDMMLNSFKGRQSGVKISVHPFRLHNDSINEPSFFEIVFYHNGIIYRYGFEVSSDRIETEWLYLREKRKEIVIFEREKDNYNFHFQQYKIGKVLHKGNFIRENALVISTAAQFNDTLSNELLSYIRKIMIVTENDSEGTENYTMGQMIKPERKEKILKFIREADLIIEDISVKEAKRHSSEATIPPSNLEDKDKNLVKILGSLFVEVFTKHTIYNDMKLDSGTIDFSMEHDESSGTRKFFTLSGPILNALENGSLLIVDELDSKLHPNLVEKILELFNSKSANQLNAQIIFNTHNTNILNSGIFRRDQIWFTDKDRYGAAKLYSLSDIKTRRKDKFEDDYLDGRYGAIPYLGYLDEMLQTESNADIPVANE